MFRIAVMLSKFSEMGFVSFNPSSNPKFSLGVAGSTLMKSLLLLK